MLEYEEDIEEFAPDLSVIKKSVNAVNTVNADKVDNTPILDDDEVESVFSDTVSKRRVRSSSKKEPKKITVKKAKPGLKPEKTIEPLKCVQTKNSVNNKCTKIEKLYENRDNDVCDDSECIDIGKNATFEESEFDELNDDDRKIAITKQTLSDTEINKLKEIIKMYLNVDELCTKLSTEVKEARSEKKQYEDHILEFMGEQNKEKITCKDSVLHKQVKQVQAKPKEEDILQTLTEILKDVDAAQEITKKIVESVPFEEKVSLKRISEKDNKSKKK